MNTSILVPPNADKEGHHKDALYPDLLPGHPCRICLAGRSGAGKGCVAKTLLAKANPAFERIVIYHYDRDTKEWDDCDYSDMITELPDNPADFWDRDVKNLLVIDEVPFEGLLKAEKSKLDRMFNYVASHYSVSVYLLQQNFCSIPVPVRRSCEYWVLWGSVDAVSIRDVSMKTGHDFAELLLLTASKYDSIMFDFTGSKYPLRLNLFHPIADSS